MKVARTKIAAVIAERLNRGESLKTLSRETAAYLLDSGRYNELNSIMRDVIAIRAKSGNVEASVSSAHQLQPAVKKDVKDLIKAVRPDTRKLIIDEQVDPELIGGLKLSVVDTGIDLSVRAKLNRLKQLANQGGL